MESQAGSFGSLGSHQTLDPPTGGRGGESDIKPEELIQEVIDECLYNMKG